MPALTHREEERFCWHGRLHNLVFVGMRFPVHTPMTRRELPMNLTCSNFHFAQSYAVVWPQIGSTPIWYGTLI